MEAKGTCQPSQSGSGQERLPEGGHAAEIDTVSEEWPRENGRRGQGEKPDLRQGPACPQAGDSHPERHERMWYSREGTCVKYNRSMKVENNSRVRQGPDHEPFANRSLDLVL